MADLEIKLIAGAVLLAALAGGVLWLEHRGAEHERAKVAEATAAQAAADAAVTAQRVTDQARIAHDATVQADAARAAAAASDRAAASLRVQLNAFVANARAADPAASGASEATGDAIGLLGRMFSESDERSGELAAALDASHAAGIACERSYSILAEH